MKESQESKAPAKKRSYIIVLVLMALLLLIGTVAYFLLKNDTADPDTNGGDAYQQPATEQELVEGAKLARQYCQSCHLLPDPLSLNKNKWKKILPQMGIRLGIKQHYGESYEESIKSADLLVPAKPLLTHQQWQNILAYYMGRSPIFLPAQARPVQIERSMPFFTIKSPGKTFSGKQVLATYVQIDTSVKPSRLFVADGQAHKLFLLDNNLKITDSIHTPGPVVDISFEKDKILICMIGTELGANDDKAGTIAELKISHSGKMELEPQPVFKGLARPVQIIAADFNGDKRTDYLLCEFGNLKGALSWMENKGNGAYTKHIMSNLPGAEKAYIDYPAGSSLPDIWVLFTQGQERISHISNQGKGHFKEMPVLRFPAINGSSFFEMVDVNRDGLKDIVYTCGDNGNATLVLKPYHGVYIFINDGHGHYAQRYFYPINGCYKAIARDFDGDGETDIATVSLYTDARQPEEGFVFLKGMGSLKFKPYALPRDTPFERAVTLADGDLNGDGKTDLVIGNAFFDIGPFAANGEEPLFYLLQNNWQGKEKKSRR